jgi:predicted nucleotidyltransferase
MAKDRIKPQEIIEEYALELKKRIEISQIILFGSAARGKMTKDSDVDLIVLSNSFRNMDFIKRLQLLSHARMGKARRVAMDILGYTPQEAKELSRDSSLLKEALRDGKLVWS